MAATASFAQSSVTVYGVVDMGYQDSKLTNGTTTFKQASMTQGPTMGNRVGFKGTEDLGAGLKANFTLEMGLDPSEADAKFGANNRQSFVGLAGNFGEFNMGRQYTLHHLNQGVGDLLGNLNSHTGYLGTFDSLIRVSNAFIYTSPTFSGVNVAVEKALGETVVKSGAVPGGNTDTTAGEKKNETTGIRLSYANGPLAAGYAWEKTDKGQTPEIKYLGQSLLPAADINSRKAQNLAASYDFGVAKVGYVNQNTKYQFAADEVKFSANTLTLSVPMGATTLLASTGKGKFAAVGEESKVSAYQLGVAYDLSKRTRAYVFTGQTNWKDEQIKLTQTSVGVRHSF